MKLVNSRHQAFSLTKCASPCPPSACRASPSRKSRASKAKGTYRVVSRRGVCGRLLPKVKIEAAIKSEMLDQVIEAIEKSANTGKIGDGKIFVFDLEQVVRIRTGETGAKHSKGEPRMKRLLQSYRIHAALAWSGSALAQAEKPRPLLQPTQRWRLPPTPRQPIPAKAR